MFFGGTEIMGKKCNPKKWCQTTEGWHLIMRVCPDISNRDGNLLFFFFLNVPFQIKPDCVYMIYTHGDIHKIVSLFPALVLVVEFWVEPERWVGKDNQRKKWTVEHLLNIMWIFTHLYPSALGFHGDDKASLVFTAASPWIRILGLWDLMLSFLNG